MGDQYMEAVRDWPRPVHTKEVERFLSFANYQQNFIPHFSEVAAPLYAITGKADVTVTTSLSRRYITSYKPPSIGHSDPGGALHPGH